MDIEYLKQLSLAGMPINIDGIGNVYPIKLKEIASVGNDKYNQYLNYICITIDNFNINEEEKKELASITSFMLILSLCTHDNNKQFLDIVTDAIRFFLKKEVVFIPYLNGFFAGTNDDLKKILKRSKDETSAIDELYKNGFINNDNYDVFKKVIMLQNCMDVEIVKKKYANAKARKIMEDLKRAKEKINKIKAKKDEPLSLFDLISAFSANSNSINIMDVWDLTLFQFNDQFKRLQMIEEYDVNIRSLLAGADSKNIKLEHWTRKITN